MKYFKKELINSFLILISVFILSCIWEFLMEPSWPFNLFTNPKESPYERWEYVITATIFCILALIIPTLRTRKLRKAREAALEEKKKLIEKLETVNAELQQEITGHKREKVEKEKLITELNKNIKDIETLQEFIPICMVCKKIRNAQGDWEKFDPYVFNHAGARFTHAICPVCAEKNYPDMVDPDPGKNT